MAESLPISQHQGQMKRESQTCGGDRMYKIIQVCRKLSYFSKFTLVSLKSEEALKVLGRLQHPPLEITTRPQCWGPCLQHTNF